MTVDKNQGPQKPKPPQAEFSFQIDVGQVAPQALPRRPWDSHTETPERSQLTQDFFVKTRHGDPDPDSVRMLRWKMRFIPDGILGIANPSIKVIRPKEGLISAGFVRELDPGNLFPATPDDADHFRAELQGVLDRYTHNSTDLNARPKEFEKRQAINDVLWKNRHLLLGALRFSTGVEAFQLFTAPLGKLGELRIGDFAKSHLGQGPQRDEWLARVAQFNKQIFQNYGGPSLQELKPSDYPQSIWLLPAVYLRNRSAYSAQPNTGEQVYLPCDELESAAQWAGIPGLNGTTIAAARPDTREIAIRSEHQDGEEFPHGYPLVHEIGHRYLNELAALNSQAHQQAYEAVCAESEAACREAEIQDRQNKGTGLVGVFGEHIFSKPRVELFSMMFGIRFTFGAEKLAELVEPHAGSLHKAFNQALAV